MKNAGVRCVLTDCEVDPTSGWRKDVAVRAGSLKDERSLPRGSKLVLVKRDMSSSVTSMSGLSVR
jgi:hypothetical protein